MDQYSRLLDFLDALQEKKTYFELGYHTDRAIMVSVVVPGERWEVEFLEEGRIRIEVFRSTGGVVAVTDINELIERATSDE